MSNTRISADNRVMEPALSELPYTIRPHQRLLYVYRTSAERTSALLRATLTGIEQGEAVIPFAGERFISLLRHSADTTGRHAVHHIHAITEVDPSEGVGPAGLVSLVRNALEHTRTLGFSRVRLLVDTQLAYTLAGTEEDFLSFASELCDIARETAVSVIQICFYEFLPRHALSDFLSMHSDVILAPALSRLLSGGEHQSSVMGLVEAIRALFLSKASILRRVLDPVVTQQDTNDALRLPRVTDYLKEKFVLLDENLHMRYVGSTGNEEVPYASLSDVFTVEDYPRVHSAIEALRDSSSTSTQTTLAGDDSSPAEVLHIHRLAFDEELVGFLCIFQQISQKTEISGETESGRRGGTDSQVTEREHEIVHLLLGGMRNREIAEKLNVAEITVKKHLGSVYRKLHVRNRIELLRLWQHE